MNFVFPDDKFIHFGTIKDFSLNEEGKVNNIVDINVLDPSRNIISIDGIEYCFTYLNFEQSGNKGGNSIILKLYKAQELDFDSVDYGDPDLILKILKFQVKKRLSKIQKRFNREVDALFDCKEKGMQNIIEIFHSGECSIFNPYRSIFEKYLYYTMEYARFDLKTYVEQNYHNLTKENKLSLCLSLSEGLNELNTLGIYHRDLKPDNIFVTDNGVWKIGDLGLINTRIDDLDLDNPSEFIGPKGWLSPESMNKYLCEDRGFQFEHDCIIDHQSDIFQLGKVFWYIFQHNAPIGTVKEIDFYIKDSRLYSIFKTMLNFSKRKRYKKIEEVIKLLKILEVREFKATA